MGEHGVGLTPRGRARGRRLDGVLWCATAACAALTLWLSLFTVPPGAESFGDADKVQHAIAYFVTTKLFLLAAVWRPGRGDGPFATWQAPLLAAILAAGAIVEIVQVPLGREGELGDWVAEAVGVAAAALLIAGLRRRAEVVGVP